MTVLSWSTQSQTFQSSLETACEFDHRHCNFIFICTLFCSYVICPGKYVVSDISDAEDSPDFPEELEQANAGDMPLLPSYEPFDVEAKGKESSRPLLSAIGRFLFRRHRSQRHEPRIGDEPSTGKQAEDKMSIEEKREVEKVFSMTTV